MDPILESYRQHKEAWRYSKRSEKIVSMKLLEALNLVKTAYEKGNHHHLLINNYIAFLLDTKQYELAFKLLEDHKPESSEFCQNYAIAIAYNRYDIHEIRKWNELSCNYPKHENAIVAYVDWHAF